MIVVDEQIHGRRIRDAIAAWYPGQVVSIKHLRPNTLVKDDAIPSLLRQVRQPTFITINADDFWRRMPAHRLYCIIAFPFPKERRHEVPELLRRLLRHPELRTKAQRMGKIMQVTPTSIAYYEADQVVHSLDWPA